MGSYHSVGLVVQFGKMKQVPEMEGGDGCTPL